MICIYDSQNSQDVQQPYTAEPTLTSRNAELGIAFDSGRRLGDEIAFHAGIDLGRGRDIEIRND